MNLVKSLFISLSLFSQALSLPAGFSKRIFGGVPAVNMDYPYAVVVNGILNTGETILCGGSIISNDTILTAAHCLIDPINGNPLRAQDVYISYGSNRQSNTTRVFAKSAKVDNNYSIGLNNTLDFGIVKIPELEFNEHVNRIPIYPGTLKELMTVEAIGWGITRNGMTATTSPVLQTVNLKISDSKACMPAYTGSINYTTPNGPTICTSVNLTPGKNVCFGDSGSALLVHDTKDFYLAGIASAISRNPQFTELELTDRPSCGLANGYDSFTNARYYLDKISKLSGISKEELTK